MDPSEDPNAWAYNNGIDTEHSWPQSKGAVGLAKSDMHHLYPTRREVNSSRGSDPFAEIPDLETDRWFRKDQILTNIPTSNIDEYSEKDDQGARFEAREDHKGNVARAMFYFYTMYEQEANNADPTFFPVQKDVLYDWHRFDPVDSLESTRTGLIAVYQEGIENPFITDSSLVRRAYFYEPATIKSENDQSPDQFFLSQNFPNPFNPTTMISYQLPMTNRVLLKVYDILGQEITTLVDQLISAGKHQVVWDAEKLPSGIYVYQLKAGNYIDSRKMILMK
jgi:endonuclease I